MTFNTNTWQSVPLTLTSVTPAALSTTVFTFGNSPLEQTINKTADNRSKLIISLSS